MDSSYGAFYEWLRHKGGYVSPDVSLFHTVATGARGVVALQDIDAGAELIRVPKNATIYMPQTGSSHCTTVKDLGGNAGASGSGASGQTQHPCQRPSAGTVRENGSVSSSHCQPVAVNDARTGALFSASTLQPESANDLPCCRPEVVRFLREVGSDTSPFAVALLLFLGELALQEISEFRPYLETLQDSTDCVWNWSQEELLELRGGMARLNHVHVSHVHNKWCITFPSLLI